MNNENILIIEDEDAIARILQLELEHEGYGVGRAADGRKGLEMANTGEWDLVLLDVMLPGIERHRSAAQTAAERRGGTRHPSNRQRYRAG